MERKERTSIIDIPIALLTGLSVTSVGVVVLALCLLMLSISEEMVEVGILMIYILSCFMAGMIIGRKRKNRRFLWGMLIGVVYYSVLYIATIFVVNTPDAVVSDVMTTLIICMGSATLGGMLS